MKKIYKYGNINFTTNILGTVVLTASSNIWVGYTAIISMAGLFIILLLNIYLKSRKNKKICKN